jgi:hypothetical protein
MSRIETDPNYSNPTFSRGTVASDLYKKEDSQLLAAAMSTHTHAPGYGLPIAASAIAPGSITGSMIADGSITGADIAAGTITSTQIAANAVGALQIADGSIGTAELADGIVTTPKLAANAASRIASAAFSAAIAVSGAAVATLDSLHYTPQAGCASLLAIHMGIWSGTVLGSITDISLRLNGTQTVPSAQVWTPASGNGFWVATFAFIANPPASDQFFQLYVGVNAGTLNAYQSRALIILEHVR